MNPRGLLLDYGGVLTTSLGPAFAAFEDEHGMPRGTLLRLLAAAYGDDSDDGPVARFERGELPRDAFEELLAAEFARAGFDVPAGSITARLFGAVQAGGPLWDVVADARAMGVRTGLLSNSWGTDGYPRDRLAAHFDAIVISGEVGLRKPDAAIYRLAADELDLPPEACVFVDDLDRNVEAAAHLGMIGVHHRDPGETAARLVELFSLRDATAG